MITKPKQEKVDLHIPLRNEIIAKLATRAAEKNISLLELAERVIENAPELQAAASTESAAAA